MRCGGTLGNDSRETSRSQPTARELWSEAAGYTGLAGADRNRSGLSPGVPSRDRVDASRDRSSAGCSEFAVTQEVEPVLAAKEVPSSAEHALDVADGDRSLKDGRGAQLFPSA